MLNGKNCLGGRNLLASPRASLMASVDLESAFWVAFHFNPLCSSMGICNFSLQLGSYFHLSLPGAIAGIADQPLQSLTRTAPSRTRAATGLVSGVGKGLMGVVTKPIGGAAELVSQTGMGLMQGAGLARFPSVRHAPREKNASEFPGSQIKVLQ